jgi:hypothetical protein
VQVSAAKNKPVHVQIRVQMPKTLKKKDVLDRFAAIAESSSSSSSDDEEDEVPKQKAVVRKLQNTIELNFQEIPWAAILMKRKSAFENRCWASDCDSESDDDGYWD